MFEQKRLGDNGTSAATSKESGDRGDEMDEKDGQVAHLAIVPISTSVTRLGTRWDLCDKSGIRHRQVFLGRDMWVRVAYVRFGLGTIVFWSSVRLTLCCCANAACAQPLATILSLRIFDRLLFSSFVANSSRYSLLYSASRSSFSFGAPLYLHDLLRSTIYRLISSIFHRSAIPPSFLPFPPLPFHPPSSSLLDYLDRPFSLSPPSAIFTPI